MKQLKGSAGDGRILINNFSAISFEFDELKSDGHHKVFKIFTGRQYGYVSIELEDKKIIFVNLSLNGFPKDLGSHNDSSLIQFAQSIMNKKTQ